MAAGQKKAMTRAEAEALYADLRKAMAGRLNGAKPALASKSSAAKSNSSVAAEIAKSIKAALATEDKAQATAAVAPTAASARTQSMAMPLSKPGSGFSSAISLLAFSVLFKLTLTVLEVSGVLKVEQASASLDLGSTSATSSTFFTAAPRNANAPFSKEEVQLLTSLDSRRVELEERNKRLDQREADLEKRDAEFATRITELRELSSKLKGERDLDDKKRSAQYDQLANVYGSMDPKEAASLIEQLDVSIALRLIARMPEKRIGQILALMSPERALAITKMLSVQK